MVSSVWWSPLVLGAEVQEHERAVAGRDLDEVLNELVARPIEAVKILQE
jgi:hypothetical protein